MTAYFIFAILAFATVLWVSISLRRGDSVQSIPELLTRSRSVDLQAFQNLIDPDEERFLRSHLAPADFRRVQRKRMRAALGYVRFTLHNSEVLLRFGQTFRRSEDPALAKAGFELVQSALNLRVYSLLAMAVFALRIIFPTVPFTCSWLVARCHRVRNCAGSLVRLEGPAYASQVESAI